jgi:hypothetical protein
MVRSRADEDTEAEIMSALDASKRLEPFTGPDDAWQWLAALDPLGWDAWSPELRAAYLKLIYPYDTDADAASMGIGQSSCALKWLAFARRLLAGRGPLHRLLTIPYAPRMGLAVSDFVAIATGTGHYHTSGPKLLEEPEILDGYLVRGPEHVGVKLAKIGDISYEIGGGKGPHGRNIDTNKRRFERQGNAMLMHSLDDETERVISTRTVLGRLDVRTMMGWAT